MIKRIAIAALALILWARMAQAQFIGTFPGLDGLIAEADAIVVLRVERNVPEVKSNSPNSIHDCLIYQSLKGTIPVGKTIRLQLLAIRGGYETPFAVGSTHLMFLSEP